ncbi:helix-turn-helix transcriptional regulator [Nonomuraea sp. 10N515B]|uniref:helix-turn-helix transcriptional regulator n=1 Tax=Nonomuraea sp. 10N515B TaxID=3457422 RepID=UPI003FCD22CC
MIPAGRDAVDGAGAAELLGMSPQTFRNKRIAGSEDFPRPFNPGRRKPLYDRASLEAYRNGRQLPSWPLSRHPDDLLDGPEAAELLDVEYATLRHYLYEARLPVVDVCGVPHIRRGDIEERRTNPGRPGRPVSR